MKQKHLFKNVSSKQAIIFIIIIIVGVATGFIASNWNIFTESFQTGWNSR